MMLDEGLKLAGMGMVGAFGLATMLDMSHKASDRTLNARIVRQSELAAQKRQRQQQTLQHDILAYDKGNFMGISNSSILAGLPGNNPAQIVLDSWNNRIGHTFFK